jgi:two-component system sensor histidine kinase VicK
MKLLEDPLFRVLFDVETPRIILKADAPAFTILAENAAHKHATNTQQRNIIGLPLFEAFKPGDNGTDDAEALISALNQAVTTGKAVHMPPFHYDIPSTDGSKMELSWWQLDILPVAGDDGSIAWLLNTTTNITAEVLKHKNITDARKSVQNLSEQLEATNEELHASNEELASTNEELTSTIEELTESQNNLQELNSTLEERVNNRVRALSESEARFRAIIEQSPAPMLLTRGDDLIFETINQPMLDLIDRDASVIGKPWHQAIPELQGQAVIDKLYHTYRTGEAWNGFEVPINVNRQGKPALGYYNLSYKPLIENGKITGIFQTATEVTEQVNIRKQIQASTNRLKSMVMTTPIGMTVLTGPNHVIEIANQYIIDIWNRTPDEVYGKPIIEVFPELIGQPFPKMLDDVFNQGKTIALPEIEVDVVTPRGAKHLYVNFSYDPLFDSDGNVEAILATVLDVTDTVEARKLLEQSEAEQQALNEELTSTNEELAAINEEYAATNEELAATNDDLQISQNQLKQALKEIKHSEQKLDDILSQLPALVVVLSGPNQIVELTNKALLNFWRKTKKEVIGRPVLSIFPELTNQPFPALWKHVYDTGEKIIHREKPVVFKNPDGTDRLSYVDYYYQPVTDVDGNRTGVLATVLDVSDKVEARKLLEIAQAEQQALNEELLATNDELAITNEELSATNRELAQSQQKLQNTLEELAESEDRMRFMLSEAPVAISMFTGHEMVIETVNKLMLHLWGKNSTIIGKTVRQALPELDGQGFFELMDNVFITGEPFYGYEVKAIVNRDGNNQEGYFNFVYQPLKDSDGKTQSIILVSTDVTEQVESRKKQQRAEEMLRFSIEAANVGTWFMDVTTHMFTASARLKELFGFYPDEEVPYELITEVIPEDYRNKVKNAIAKAIDTGENYVMEHPVIGRHDQKQRWVRGLGKLYADSNGKLSHFSGLVFDITEEKQDELRKNDFIGMVSHELKTPLTTITAIVQMLNIKAKKAEDAFNSTALEKANVQVKKMANMINGFLNISRLESGKIQLDKHYFELAELVQATIEENRVISPNHIISILPSNNFSLYADKDKIGSVISNILSNAVKYSPKDTNIDVKFEQKDGKALVSITDQGIGIKPHDIEKLFERYYRVQNSQHVAGFGIGLYLSAEIIHRHGGDIWVESQEGTGSTFYFTLPLG